MTLAVDVAVESGRLPLGRARISELVRGVLRAERVRHAMISVTFLPNRDMAALHREHLNRYCATDVLSFGFVPPATGSRSPVIGDIYVAPSVARFNARRHGVGVREELARLVVHGTLHVLGYDHPDDGLEREGSPMWRRQEQLLQRLHRERRR